MSKNNKILTNSDFWDDFWDDVSLPDLVNKKIQWHLALTTTLQNHLPKGQNLKLFEVGCAPGRWLIWFNKKMGYQIAGCEYSPHGLKLVYENFLLNNVDGKIYHADFLKDPLPEQVFDVVISIGFIEHFDDPMPVIKRHVDLLKPGGYLVIEVPNMAGWLNHRLLCMAGMRSFLAAHNLTIMNRLYFKKIARVFDLETKLLGYIGGFDPGLVVNNYSQEPENRVRLRNKLLRGKHLHIPILLFLERLSRRFPSLFVQFNASCCSHMLIGIYKKPDSNNGD